MIARIARLFHLEVDEARHALMLGGILFMLSASYTLVKTARDALFLARFPAQVLPWVFLGVGVLTTIAAAGFTRLMRGRRASDALELAAVGSSVVLAGFAYLSTFRFEWVPFALFLWVNVYGVILLSLFWSHTTGMSDPLEAKRTFGLIGTFGVLGGLAGGALAGPLASLGGAAPILAAGAAVTAFAPALARASRGGALGIREPAPAERGSAGPLFRLAYVRWIALATLCGVLVSTILDYQLKIAVQARDPSPQAIASFLGSFYAVANLVSLPIQLFASRWALQSLGAGWSAALLPAGLGLGAGAVLLGGGFPAVVGGRLWDQVMRGSLARTATELFYLPLPPELRIRAKAWIDAGLERIGDALAGALLLLAGMVMGADARSLSVLALALVAVWALAWIRLRRGYVAELGRNLRRMNLDLTTQTITLRESRMLEAMVRLLSSPYERVVVYGLEMLEQNAPDLLNEHLPRLLGHPSARVRARTVAIAASRTLAAIQDRIDDLCADPDLEVRLEAMRARIVRGGASPIEALHESLEADDPEVRRGALQIVAEYTPVAESARLLELFERLRRTGDERTQELLAEAIGARSMDDTLRGLLGEQMRSPQVRVRNAALISAGRVGQRTAVPQLIEALGPVESRAAARIGLAAFGDRVVGTLGDYLMDPGVPSAIRREIPRALGRIGSGEAAKTLLRYREQGDVRLSYRVLKAMNKIRTNDPQVPFPRGPVTEDVAYDSRSHLFALVHYRTCPIGKVNSPERLLCIALNERMEQALNRIFRRLALLYPPDNIYAAYRGIASSEPRARANSIEYLENALTADHLALVLPLVDDSGEDHRIALAESRHGIRYRGYVESLEDLIRGSDSWLRAVALYVAGARREHALRGPVEESLTADSSIVRETARWAQLALAAAPAAAPAAAAASGPVPAPAPG